MTIFHARTLSLCELKVNAPLLTEMWFLVPIHLYDYRGDRKLNQ
jgi:hypothetical protein